MLVSRRRLQASAAYTLVPIRVKPFSRLRCRPRWVQHPQTIILPLSATSTWSLVRRDRRMAECHLLCQVHRHTTQSGRAITNSTSAKGLKGMSNNIRPWRGQVGVTRTIRATLLLAIQRNWTYGAHHLLYRCETGTGSEKKMHIVTNTSNSNRSRQPSETASRTRARGGLRLQSHNLSTGVQPLLKQVKRGQSYPRPPKVLTGGCCCLLRVLTSQLICFPCKGRHQGK